MRLGARHPGVRAHAAEPARISAHRRLRGRIAEDAGRQGQSQGAARARDARTDMSDDPNRLFPKITDDALDALRRRVNVRIENTLEPWCHEATRDCDPPLRAWHRRRQSAVVRSGLRSGHALGRHRRVAELPVRHQPDHFRLCRRPARCARDVGWRRLDLASAGAAQRRDHHRGMAEGPDRTPDAVSPDARSSRSITSTSTTSAARWSPPPTVGAFAPIAIRRGNRAASTTR